MQKRGRKEKTTKKRNMVSDRHREENENTSLPPPPFVFGLFVCWLVGLFVYLFCANRWSSSGHRMSLSSVATMAVKAGRWARSFCQQSNMRLWMASGQSIGAGSLRHGTRKNKMNDRFRTMAAAVDVTCIPSRWI